MVTWITPKSLLRDCFSWVSTYSSGQAVQVDDPTFKPVCRWALGYAGFRLGVGALEVTRSGPRVRSHTLASPLPAWRLVWLVGVRSSPAGAGFPSAVHGVFCHHADSCRFCVCHHVGASLCFLCGGPLDFDELGSLFLACLRVKSKTVPSGGDLNVTPRSPTSSTFQAVLLNMRVSWCPVIFRIPLL